MSSNSLPFVVRTDKPTDILTDWKTLQQKAKQPFADIAALETNKQHQGTPFFNTSFVYNQWEEEQRVKPLHTNATESAFDVSLDFIEEGNELYFQWEFNLFTQYTCVLDIFDYFCLIKFNKRWTK